MSAHDLDRWYMLIGAEMPLDLKCLQVFDLSWRTTLSETVVHAEVVMRDRLDKDFRFSLIRRSRRMSPNSIELRAENASVRYERGWLKYLVGRSEIASHSCEIRHRIRLWRFQYEIKMNVERETVEYRSFGFVYPHDCVVFTLSRSSSSCLQITHEGHEQTDTARLRRLKSIPDHLPTLLNFPIALFVCESIWVRVPRGD